MELLYLGVVTVGLYMLGGIFSAVGLQMRKNPLDNKEFNFMLGIGGFLVICSIVCLIALIILAAMMLV